YEGAASRPASRQPPRRPRPRAGGHHRDTLTRAACCRLQSSKRLDTTSRAVYALPVRRRVAGVPATMTPPPIKEMSMTKAELVDQVATTVDLSKSQTEAVLTQCLQAIMDALQAGESVELRGFGRFHPAPRPPRAGRNPRTGETIPIPAKAVPTFTAGKAFQERVQPSAAAAGGAA